MADLKLGTQIGGNLVWHQGILKLNPTDTNLYFKNWDIITSKGGQSIAGSLTAQGLVSTNGVIGVGTDNGWGVQPTRAAFAQQIDNTTMAHWLLASTKSDGSIRSGIQVRTDDTGVVRIYTNKLANYTEFGGGQITIQASIPSAAGHATRKDYVDGQIQSTLSYVDSEITTTEGLISTLNSSVVKLTGDQTVAGVKTFSSLPLVSADPTSSNQLVRKAYADLKVAKTGDTMTGQLVISTPSTLPLKIGSSTWKALVGVSSVTNEYIFGGSSTGGDAPTSYYRIGPSVAKVSFDGTTQYDVITSKGGYTITGDMTFGGVVGASGVVQSASAIVAQNPNALTATASMKFLNDIATIRYGGSGAGASNGFQIAGSGDAVKMMVSDAGEIYAAGNYRVYHTNNKPTAGDVGAIPLTGSTAITGTLRTTGELQTTSSNSLRMVYGNYGAFWRNDGSNYYLMLTASGDQYGSYNGLRPFSVNLSSGMVNMSNGLNVSSVTVTNGVTAASFTGPLTGNASTATALATARTLTIGDTGKTFNGSANVSWTLAEIGAADSAHTHTQINSRGTVTAETGTTAIGVAGLSQTNAYNNGYPATYGNVLNMNGGGCGQLFIEWSGASTSSVGVHGGVWVRSKRDTSGVLWSDWARFYTTAYKPTASDVGAVDLTGDTMTGNLLFADSGTAKRGIQGTSGANDQWFVGGGATASDAGYMEIATGDGGVEPIYVRQYSGNPLTGTVTRTLTLLDASGNTTVPGTLTAGSQITASWAGDFAFANQKTTGAAFFSSYSSGGTSEFHPLVKMRGTPSGGVHWTSTFGQLLSGSVIENTCIHAISSGGTSWSWYFKHSDGSFETPSVEVRQNGYVDFAGNSSWGGTLRVGGNGFSVTRASLNASVATTNGNLHLDSGLDRALHLNYYSGTGGIIFGNGASGSSASMTAAGVFTMTGLVLNGDANATGLIKGSRFATNAYDSGVGDSFSCGNWFRSSGATGWYNATYGGGIYMVDNTWVRVSHNKAFFVDNTANDAIYTTGGVKALGAVTAYSDIRLKTDIEPIYDALEKVKKVSGVTYTQKSTGRRMTGVIAQEIHEVLPEAVDIDKDGIMSVAYGNLVGMLIEAIKEQQEQINELRGIVNGLHN